MIVKALATVLVVVVVSLGLLGVGWYSRGTFELLTLPHGVLGSAVKLALVVHDHVKVTFKEGGRSVGAKSALNANHTASRTRLASHAQRANDVPVNFS
jgi:hypothetical protein